MARKIAHYRELEHFAALLNPIGGRSERRPYPGKRGTPQRWRPTPQNIPERPFVVDSTSHPRLQATISDGVNKLRRWLFVYFQGACGRSVTQGDGLLLTQCQHASRVLRSGQLGIEIGVAGGVPGPRSASFRTARAWCRWGLRAESRSSVVLFGAEVCRCPFPGVRA
jgi:hypothetical protein